MAALRPPANRGSSQRIPDEFKKASLMLSVFLPELACHAYQVHRPDDAWVEVDEEPHGPAG